ncbi:MAG: hypothetical protein WCF16_09210 [Alphaproteobacteria bacterium]
MIGVSRSWGLSALAMILAAGLSLSACGKKEESAEKPSEESMGEAVKGAAQDAGKAMEEAGQKAGEATEKAGEDAGKAMDEGTKEEAPKDGAPSE